MSPNATTKEVLGTNKTAGGQIEVKVVRSLAGIEEIRPYWERWQYHPNSDIDYYLSRFHLRPEFVRPHIIVVHRDGRPDAMLVGRLDKLPMGFRLGYWRWSRGERRVLSFLYAGLLGNGSQENVRTMVGEIMRSLREGEADTASLVNVRVGSPLYEASTRMPGFISRDHYHIPYAHCSMTLPGDKNEWYRGMPRRTRETLKRRARRFVEGHGGSFGIQCFRSEPELERVLRDVEEVASKTYQRGLGVGFHDNEETRQRLRMAAREGRLRAFILYIEGKPAAFQVGTLYGETLHLYFTGYDPQHERYSPGTFLVAKDLEGMCGSEVKEVDFEYGDEDYKQRLSTNRWLEATVCIFPASLKGLAQNLVRTLSLLMGRFVKSGLQRMGLLARLKKVWRRRVTNRQPAAPPNETEAGQ